MNQYLKGALIILASAMIAFATTATQTHDPWTIGLAVIGSIGTTTLALLMQSPLPRKEWTDEEREANIAKPAEKTA